MDSSLATRLVTINGECFDVGFQGKRSVAERDGVFHNFHLTDLVRERGILRVSICRGGPKDIYVPTIAEFDRREDAVVLNTIRRAFDHGDLSFDVSPSASFYREISLEPSDFAKRPLVRDSEIRTYIIHKAYWLSYRHPLQLSANGVLYPIQFDEPLDLEYLGADIADMVRNVQRLRNQGLLEKVLEANARPTERLLQLYESGDYATLGLNAHTPSQSGSTPNDREFARPAIEEARTSVSETNGKSHSKAGLDRVRREYAAMLYQKRVGEILESQKVELGKVVEDFGRRNMLQSGMYLSARAKVMGRHVGLMAEAMTQSLLYAHEKAGLPFNQATLQEITTEVNQFCEAQKKHLRRAAHNLVSQQFTGQSGGQPSGLVDALAGEMESALSHMAANALRELAIKHHEILLEHERGIAKPHSETGVKEWDVFISHASEDKESFVRPLANALEAAGLRVWFDATALTVGDSLRTKIDEGLSHSRYGIVVLSPNFFVKRWPQNELDGLISREVSGVKVILPVWHNISFEGVRAYSPMLAGRLAAKSSDGMEKVVEDLMVAIRT